MRAAAWLAIALILVPGSARAGSPAAAGPGVRVLASFLPMYVFTRNVAAGVPGVEVDLMLPAALGCPHDYALTPGDMRKIAAADLFVANGRGMEEFLGPPVLRANPKIRIVETAAAVAPLRTGEGGRGGVNPHTWVSPRNAIVQVRAIQKALSDASPADAAAFRRNADAYAARLAALADALDAAARRFRARNVVTFHNAFDYLARDAGLSVVGRIEETPGQEPSAGEIHALVRTIRRTRAAAVFAEPQYPERLAAIVAQEAGVPLRVLDPLSTGAAEPTAYEEAMRKNLAIMVDVLGSR